MLGVVVTDMAYRVLPGPPRGVARQAPRGHREHEPLADVARELGLGELVLLGKGEELCGGRDKASILADALEAVFGAVYLDRGLDVATELIERLFRPRMEAYVRGEGERDYKTVLQELASQEVGSVPEYRRGGPRSRPPEGVHGHRVPGRASRGAGASAVPRRKPSSRPRARRTRASRGERPERVDEGGAEVELPEVEVMRRDLEKDVVGRRIKTVEVQGPKTRMRREPAPQDAARSSPPCSPAARSPRSNARGKYLLMHLDGGDVLVVHFGMSGQFLRGPGAWPPAPHTHVVFTFQQGGDLRFVDPRTFGEIFVAGRRSRQGQGAPAPRDRPARPGVHLAGVPVPVASGPPR